MFNRKRIQELEHRLSILNSKVGQHYERVTALRTRVGEDGLARLRHDGVTDERLTKVEQRLKLLENAKAQPETIIGVDYGAGPDMTTGVVLQKVGSVLRVVAGFRVIHDEIILDLQGQVQHAIEVPEIMAAVRKAVA